MSGAEDEPPITTASSRAIDPMTGQYVVNAAGNFEAMPDLHQRVVLLIAYNVRVPRLIGPSFRATIAAEVRRALRPLTHSRPPQAVIKSIAVEPATGGSLIFVTFADGQKVKAQANGTP